MRDSEFYFQLYRCLAGVCVLSAISLLLYLLAYSIVYSIIKLFPKIKKYTLFYKVFCVRPKVVLIVLFALVLSQQINEYYFNKFNEINLNLVMKDVVGNWKSGKREICFYENGTVFIKYPANEQESNAKYYELKESSSIIIYDEKKMKLMQWRIERFRGVNRLFDQVNEFEGTPYYGSRYKLN